ncbi:dTDP-4-dehydrorhamnose reductase [Agromyces sp. NPDC056965]|uniref:dTDP-4-dehydrorhamnose reductase n=1 Tax=Agromyces sp. NPDC056965 TaxID=3345983 RepID=UPI00363455C1
MRYLVTGAAGMLGRDLQTALAGRDVTALSRAEFDVTDAASVRSIVGGHDVIINCAAYTKVDAAEADEDAAYAINATGVGTLATAAADAGAKLVSISTDYVFNGSATSPYAEDGTREPISAYGRTKAAGEELALDRHPDGTYIVRTAWLYGAHGPNFAKTMLRLARTKESWAVVDDQIGQPTWTADLAAQIVLMLDSNAPTGIYHGTNSGQTTWFDFARAVLEERGIDPSRITRTDSASFALPAPRPSYSVLGHDAWSRAALPEMRDWRAALSAASADGAIDPE